MTRRNKYKKDMYGHIIGKVGEKSMDDLVLSNAFETLSEEVINNKVNEK